MWRVRFLLLCLLCWVSVISSVVIRYPSFKIPWQKIFPDRSFPVPDVFPAAQLSPVILIPGDGGSQLEAKLNKPSVVHYVCQQKSTAWFDLWLNIELMLPVVLDCWVDNMRLVYNNVTKRTENSPGVDIRVVGFGNSSAVEYIDASRVSISKYFVDIANVLVQHGYKRDVSLRGAPYDFRKAPTARLNGTVTENADCDLLGTFTGSSDKRTVHGAGTAEKILNLEDELSDFFVSLKQLVEETFEMNNQTSVTFIGHSMGNLMGLHFLHQQSPEWKAKYMKGFISLGAPWAGAVKALKAVASGDNLNVALISAFRVRAEQRTNPSVTALFPSPDFWDHNQTFVLTPNANYSLSNLKDFFLDMGFEDGWEMYKRSSNTFAVKPPGVPVYCMYGIGVDTPTQMIYGKGQFPDSTPKVVMGDGDGTVNRRSLEVCSVWQKMRPNTVEVFPFDKVSHMTVLSNPNVLNTIAKVLWGLKETK